MKFKNKNGKLIGILINNIKIKLNLIFDLDVKN